MISSQWKDFKMQQSTSLKDEANDAERIIKMMTFGNVVVATCKGILEPAMGYIYDVFMRPQTAITVYSYDNVGLHVVPQIMDRGWWF